MAQHYQPLEAREMIAGMARRIELIEQCANEVDKRDFARKWLSVISACANWFGALPLSPDLYREPGGGFRATVEIAFYAMRLAGGQKFGSTLRSEVRRRLEPQYNYAVFLAAMCSKLDEPHRHFDVVRVSDGVIWQPSSDGPVMKWAAESPFVLQRRATALPIERMRTGMLAQMVIGSELLAGIEAEVQSALFGAINPSMQPISSESIMHKVLREAITVATDVDRRAQQSVFAPVSADIPSAADIESAAAPSAGAPAPASSSPLTASATAGPNTVGAELLDAVNDSVASVPTITPPSMPNGSTAQATPSVIAASTKASEAVEKEVFDAVLQGASGMIKDFFRALREDVVSGTAKVTWNEKGLVLSKRLIGGYGIASDTLVEQLRKRSLVIGNSASEVVLAPRAGALISDAPDT